MYISETDRLLNLFLYRSNAFLLLSYLKLMKNPDLDFSNQLFRTQSLSSFHPRGLQALGGRTILTESQVKRGLKILVEFGFISMEKLSLPLRGSFKITILDGGHEYE